MKKTRDMISDLFGSPIQNMTFPHYLQYMNESGKVTARSIMEMCAVLLTKCDDIEKKQEEFEHNFKEIEQILAKLVDTKVEEKVPEINKSAQGAPVDEKIKGIAPASAFANSTSIFPCDQCDKILTTQSGLTNHKRIKHGT